ncbi:MAG: hypothetical protein EOQ40_29035 [Mesorhizobium sp.]|nr:MAG: hypothetical protein EOQ40_29035 [Mesorhizobium sp.]
MVVSYWGMRGEDAPNRRKDSHRFANLFAPSNRPSGVGDRARGRRDKERRHASWQPERTAEFSNSEGNRIVLASRQSSAILSMPLLDEQR